MIYNVHTESVLNKINEHVQKLNEAIKFATDAHAGHQCILESFGKLFPEKHTYQSAHDNGGCIDQCA